MTAIDVLNKVLERTMPEIYKQYFPVAYSFIGTYDWLDRHTCLRIKDEKHRDYAVAHLSHYAKVITGLQELIDKKYITKEEVMSMFTDKPEH